MSSRTNEKFQKRNEAIKAARKKITLLAEIAKAYYVDGWSQLRIAEEKEIDPSYVTRLLKEARDKRVVYFNVDARFGFRGVEHAQLSRKLRDEFGLETATVVRVGCLEESHVDYRVEDDLLHATLGNHEGEIVANRIDPGDHIALGPGRPVFQVARVIVRCGLSRTDVRITPLCGRIWTHEWSVSGRRIWRPVDSDDAVFVLALGLENEPGTRFSQVEYPLFADNPAQAKAIMTEQRFLPGGQWKEKLVPRRAIVGVGCVHRSGGHRFGDLLTGHVGREPEFDRYLKVVARSLQALVPFAERWKMPYVGDVVNRLFPALPLPEGVTRSKLSRYAIGYREMFRKINELNDRIVAAEWSHLRAIPSVTAIAGGKFKTEVLWTLLIVGYLSRRFGASRRILTELCTDDKNAEQLLNALHYYHQAPQWLRDWYVEMAKKLF